MTDLTVRTLNALAKAYEDAGASDQAADTRRQASQESVLRLFAQAGVGAQQRQLDQMSGPERAMAEEILNRQAARARQADVVLDGEAEDMAATVRAHRTAGSSLDYQREVR
jgi:hypothetical protein